MSWSWAWERQTALEEELVVMVSWGVSKTKRDRREVQEAKLNLQGDRMLETPEKLLIPDARQERANSQQCSWEKYLRWKYLF